MAATFTAERASGAASAHLEDRIRDFSPLSWDRLGVEVPISLERTGKNAFGYGGSRRQILNYLRARYYDPSTAQFLTRDPLLTTTRSPYAYAIGNPLNRADPWGLFATTGDEGASTSGDPWFSWSQAVQDLYIRALGQLQGAQNAQVKLQEDPGKLFQSSPGRYVEHIEQIRTDQGAISTTVAPLGGLSGGGHAACHELKPFTDEALNFDPVAVRGLPSEYTFGGVDNSRIVPRLGEVLPGEDPEDPFIEPIIPVE